MSSWNGGKLSEVILFSVLQWWWWCLFSSVLSTLKTVLLFHLISWLTIHQDVGVQVGEGWTNRA